ncbi:hypothetical protein HPB52_021238 [Rhipicephalus sanguineus]|uniref:Uncharacterized protein n=1 Tax=Rhipicephalus sanguineus TaxID=34632 RepID=A0A9D4Q334_RHISA|nr:hypothetical protein HPB52_021238 [Rhipicephalus sanguineus]
MVVPPNYVGFVKLYVTGSEPNADVFVDAQLRCQEGREHCIPRCVINVDAANETCIPVMNVSYQALNIKANERVARAEVVVRMLTVARTDTELLEDSEGFSGLLHDAMSCRLILSVIIGTVILILFKHFR